MAVEVALELGALVEVVTFTPAVVVAETELDLYIKTLSLSS